MLHAELMEATCPILPVEADSKSIEVPLYRPVLRQPAFFLECVS